jgi:hypothetical protein
LEIPLGTIGHETDWNPELLRARIAPIGSPRTPTARIATTTPGLIIRILNPVFLKILNHSVTLTRYRPTP